MIIARSVQSAASKAGLAESGCVVTIGNFDGLHIGHQAMLRSAREQADKLKIPLLVMSFDPHPEAYFSAHDQSARLSSIGERVLGLKQLKVDIACILPFNRALAELSHTEFVDVILVKQFNAKCLVIGDDFQYGKGRAGSAMTLSKAGQRANFDVVRLDTIMGGEQRASSSVIRSLLNLGKLAEAAKYLGRNYSMMGRVTHGEKRGRSWGFPTLNLPVNHKRALKGVFAVRVKGLKRELLDGVANLGKRPTVDGLTNLLEVHLFDYQGDAYGKRVCVEFFEQIRQEKKFASFDALKAQIARDKEQAKAYFTQEKH